VTVCIGAVCDDGKSVVVAADRMMTYGAPISLQVEMAVKKIVPVSDACAILFSGSVPDGEEVISRTKRLLTDGLSIGEVAQKAAACYQEVKNQRVEETILKPWLGIGFAGFSTIIAQSSSSQMLGQIFGMVMQHNLQLELLVAGITDGRAHLCAITHPGITLGLDTIGCSAIGSGGLHANVRLALGKQSTAVNLSETIYNVYEAKLAAESAPGVGKLSDIAVISGGKTIFLDESALNMLASLQNGAPRPEAASLAKLEELVKEKFNG
jgi:20S proteasome alpha/beta subunit